MELPTASWSKVRRRGAISYPEQNALQRRGMDEEKRVRLDCRNFWFITQLCPALTFAARVRIPLGRWSLLPQHFHLQV